MTRSFSSTTALACLAALAAGCSDSPVGPEAGAIPRPSFAAEGAGAIWTTDDACGDATQDANHFTVGDKVYINGAGFAPDIQIAWSITGAPGGASSDPNAVVASGNVTPGAGGTFCVEAYTVLAGDRGEYQVKAGTKGDNYRVRGDENLAVSKTAVTTLTRTWTWDLAKSADQSALTLAPGQSLGVNYEVTASYTSAESDWGVSGVITVLNDGTGNKPTKVTGVSDLITIGAANYTATIGGCWTTAAMTGTPVAFPVNLSPGASLYCSYTHAFAADPGDGLGSNVATATAEVGNGANAETVSFSNDPVGLTFDEASSTPAAPAVTKVDQCAVVSDLFAGGGAVVLGSPCATGLSGSITSWQYAMTVGAYTACGNYQVANTATLIAEDTGTTETASATVDVAVPCGGSCTLTQGYWKTHSEKGPAPYDDTWALLASGADTPFYLSGQTWHQVFWTAPKGNAYYNLAHQFMAARLNQLNGADASAVSQALSDAAALFGTYPPAQVAALKGNDPIRAQFSSLAGTLGSFNEGLTGPGHCSE